MKVGGGSLKPEYIHLQSIVCSAHSKYTILPLGPCKWRVTLERNKEEERVFTSRLCARMERPSQKSSLSTHMCFPSVLSRTKITVCFQLPPFKGAKGFLWKSLETLTIQTGWKDVFTKQATFRQNCANYFTFIAWMSEKYRLKGAMNCIFLFYNIFLGALMLVAFIQHNLLKTAIFYPNFSPLIWTVFKREGLL